MFKVGRPSYPVAMIIAVTGLVVDLRTSQAYELAKSTRNSQDYNVLMFSETEWDSPLQFMMNAYQPLSKLGSLSNCRLVIDLAAGTDNGNHSYGALCSITGSNQTVPVMICADELMGRVAVRFANGPVSTSRRSLINFVADSCYGG